MSGIMALYIAILHTELCIQEIQSVLKLPAFLGFAVSDWRCLVSFACSIDTAGQPFLPTLALAPLGCQHAILSDWSLLAGKTSSCL